MNVYEYCDVVVAELSNWRKKLTELDHRIAALSGESEIKRDAEREDLHMMLAEMEDRIYHVEHACPTSLKPASKGERVGPVLINYEAAIRQKSHSDHKK